MDRSRKVVRMLIAAAAIAGFFGAASLCYGEEPQGQGGGSTFVTLGATNSMDLRAGLEHKWPAGLGAEVAVGCSLLSLEGALIITGEALAVLPLFKLGRSSALDLALGMPDLTWVTSAQALMVSFGASARLRFELGSRWSLLVRAGACYPLFFEPTGFRSGSNFGVMLDLGIGVAFRL